MMSNLSIRDRLLQDKTAYMDSLWDDMLHVHEVMESPTWHQIVHAERRKPFVEGPARFIDRETAYAFLSDSQVQRTGDRLHPSSIILSSEETHGHKGDYDTRDP